MVFRGEEEGGGVRSGPGAARTILLFHIISARPSKQPLMVRTFLKVYVELGSYFLFLQEHIKDIIIITSSSSRLLPPTSPAQHGPLDLQRAWRARPPEGHVIRRATSSGGSHHLLVHIMWRACRLLIWMPFI